MEPTTLLLLDLIGSSSINCSRLMDRRFFAFFMNHSRLSFVRGVIPARNACSSSLLKIFDTSVPLKFYLYLYESDWSFVLVSKISLEEIWVILLHKVNEGLYVIIDDMKL